jgi:hypothetical protein
VSKKGPSFLKVYVIPVLILNLALVGWDVVAAYAAYNSSIYVGHAVIITVGLYLYLIYLDRYLR